MVTPDVDFLVTDDPGGGDEELPAASEPWWVRARVPLGVAAAVALLAGVMFRLTAAGDQPGQAPAATGTSAAASATGSPVVAPSRTNHGGYVVKIGRVRIGVGPTCAVEPQCIVTEGAPHAVIEALRDHLPGARVVFARTTLERTGIAGQHHRFRSVTVVARRGAATIRITVSRAAKPPHRPATAGEHETAVGSVVYARTYVPGYVVSIRIVAPTGRAPADVREVVKFATDGRLVPLG